MKLFLTLLGGLLLGSSEASEPPTLEYGFVGEPQDIKVLQGESVEFVCEVYGMGPGNFISWINGTNIVYFDRHKVNQDDRITMEVDGNKETLKIKDVDTRDEGTILCQISGSYTVAQEKKLTVNIPPSVIMEPDERHIDLILGESIDISCVTAGKPTPIVTWSRTDGAPVFANGETHQTGETLSFDAVDKHHTGTYSCAASNGFGSDVTKHIDINVMYKPTVEAEDVYYTDQGKTTELTCRFDANPKVQVMWFHNNVDINFTERTNIVPKQNGGTATLIISNVEMSDLGMYTCHGANEKGEVQTDVELSVKPYGLRILSEEESPYSDSYILEWQVASVAQLIECNLKIYEANKSEEIFLENNTIPVTQEAMTHSYQITGLHANGTFVAYLNCRNKFASTVTEEIEFYTSSEENPNSACALSILMTHLVTMVMLAFMMS